MSWFNPLATDPKLSSALANLATKVAATTQTAGGCITVDKATKDTRPVLDKRYKDTLRAICPDSPERFMPYHICLAGAASTDPTKLVPSYDPPRLPTGLRHVLQKRSANAAEGNDKDATWVCSHLCHNSLCVNPEHLAWEPSWMNRLRDNCAGGSSCLHRPHPCLNSHGARAIIDWTEYL